MSRYDSEPRLLEHLQIQAGNIDHYGTAVGASAAIIAALKDDAAYMGQIIEYANAVEVFKETVFSIKKSYIRGEMNVPLGDLPEAPPPPSLRLVAGVEKRSRERDRRFSLAEGINEEIKVALDLTDDTLRPNPGTVKPTIKVSGADEGYQFTVEVSNRADADMFSIEIRRMNGEKWTEIKSGTGKTVVVTVQPTAAGQSERLEIRVRLSRRNENYGIPSDPQYVTVNP